MTVYTPDGDEMGKLIKVDDDESCVLYEDEQHSIVKDFKYKGDTYFHSVIDNKAYQPDGDGDMKLVGEVTKKKSGKLKVNIN